MTASFTRPRALIELSRFDAPPAALADNAYAAIKRDILTCKLRPGLRLVEKELCAAMGISRTPLREALNRLGLEGLVSLVPYHGYKVTQVTLQDIRDMCELRYVLEAETSSLAAQRASDEEITRLSGLAELCYVPGVRETYEDYLRANSAFHIALARCSHNARLEATVVSLLDHLQRPLYLGLDVGLDADAATVEHLALIAALRQRDSHRSATVMRKQIKEAEERMLAAIRKSGLDSENDVDPRND